MSKSKVEIAKDLYDELIREIGEVAIAGENESDIIKMFSTKNKDSWDFKFKNEILEGTVSLEHTFIHSLKVPNS